NRTKKTAARSRVRFKKVRVYVEVEGQRNRSTSAPINRQRFRHFLDHSALNEHLRKRLDVFVQEGNEFEVARRFPAVGLHFVERLVGGPPLHQNAIHGDHAARSLRAGGTVNQN